MALDPSYFLADNRITTSSVIQGKDASQLDMNDFFNLLVAQLTNQDMMNPVSDTEFIAQMAQFASLQGIQTLSEYTLSSYATSYVGKYVTIANQTNLGSIETVTGQVESVSFYDGSPKVIVGGKSYDLYMVMEISNSANAGSLNEAANFVGKRVKVEYLDEWDNTKSLIGYVTSVTLVDNVPHVIIDGKEYPVSQVKSIVEDETEASTASSASGASASLDTDEVTVGTNATAHSDYANWLRTRELNDM